LHLASSKPRALALCLRERLETLFPNYVAQGRVQGTLSPAS